MAGLGVLAVTAIALWRGASGVEPPASPLPVRPANVLLVTIDTLRADRVGAYGAVTARTPALDGLAARGVRFDGAYTTAPITLPAHASLLTGLYPPHHGARHNGMRVNGAVKTLASVLQEQGFQTGAFVAAFPLDRRFGLEKGFGVYSDRMPRSPDGRLLNERPGSIVVDETIRWIRGVAPHRFFAWIHLFEPHAPYEPDSSRLVPGVPRSAADRYDDEIARADREVGRLLEALGATLESTLVVVAGDHGEAFGEHGEIGHSVFVYDTTLRVPLIFARAGVARPAVVHDAVALVDVFPTVLDLLGVPAREADGLSLAGVIEGGPLAPRALFAESFAPLLDFGWSSLRAVRVGGRKYIAAPQPELYDVDSDRQEQVNLVDAHPEQVRALAARVGSYSGPELPADAVAAGIDHGASARLQALGYVAGGTTRRSTGRPDPKDRRDLAARIAQVTSGELQGKELRAALTSIVRDDPGNAQAHLRLGYVLLESGDCGGAESHFRAAIDADLPSADPYLGLAQCLGARGDIAQARAALVDARRVEPGNPVVEANLGIAALAQGDTAGAMEALTAALTIAPDLHEARFNLARAYARAGRRPDAAREARTLLAELPVSAPQRAEVERLLHAVE